MRMITAIEKLQRHGIAYRVCYTGNGGNWVLHMADVSGHTIGVFASALGQASYPLRYIDGKFRYDGTSLSRLIARCRKAPGSVTFPTHRQYIPTEMIP